MRVLPNPSRPRCSNRSSLCPARRKEGTQKSERCLWSFPARRFPHSPPIKAAEKSLAILRASPEQATANLASGIYTKLPHGLSPDLSSFTSQMDHSPKTSFVRFSWGVQQKTPRSSQYPWVPFTASYPSKQSHSLRSPPSSTLWEIASIKEWTSNSGFFRHSYP